LLDNLPTIRVITLRESADRRDNFVRQINKYTNNYKFIICERFETSDFSLKGETLQALHSNSYGPIASHLYNLYDWYNTCQDDFCIIMEDDVSFETLDYWKFTLKEFISILPTNWEAIQLVNVGEGLETPTKIRSRNWNDWCIAAFIVKRSYAKKVIDQHVIAPNNFCVDLKTSFLPIVENVILDPSNSNVYIFPLFVEDTVNCKSTYKGTELVMYDGQGPLHHDSHEFILNWWKNNNIDLQRISI
jgi:hypothetical protein